MPAATSSVGLTAGSPESRANDLMQAFLDPDIDGVICSIGGRLSSQVLPLLDLDVIGGHPKVFCGYSDVTTLHSALGRFANLGTFYGPAVMPDWAEPPAPASESVDSFMSAACTANAVGLIPNPACEVVEYADWSADRVRRFAPAFPPMILRQGRARGRLTGGCLPVLCELLGTPWFPEVQGAILYLDFPNEYSSVDAASDLWHLLNAGVLDEVAGIATSRPHLGKGVEQFAQLVIEATARCRRSIPVIAGIACGHTIPNLTLPLGCISELEGSSIRIVEAAVCD
jgi:muramoyltetrapeptide carboxypeptidase